MMPKPLKPTDRRCLNALHRGAEVEYFSGGMSGFTIRWPNGMSEEVCCDDSGLYRINDAAVRYSMDVLNMPRQSEYLEFINQVKGSHYRSVVVMLPETVPLAREISADFDATKLMPSEVKAMRVLADGGVDEEYGESRFSWGSWWSASSDSDVRLTTKVMRTLCGRGFVEQGSRRRHYVISNSGRARLAQIDCVSEPA